MSLEAALAATPHTAKGPVCGVARIKAELGERDAAFLEEQLAKDDQFMVGRLAAALKAEGYAISSETLRRHKRRTCACP